MSDNELSWNMISVPFKRLDFYFNLHHKLSTDILEIKPTTGARVRRTPLPTDLNHMPHAVLPGSGHQFSVKMDKDQKFHLIRVIPKAFDEYQYAILPPTGDYSNSILILDLEQLKKVLDAIYIIQTLLLEYHVRASDKILSVDDDHILMPNDLRQTIVSLEGVFSDASVDTTLIELDVELAKIKTIMMSRVSRLNEKLKELVVLMGGSIEEDPWSSKNDSYSLPRFERKEWAGQSVTVYDKYIGGNIPNQYNRINVNELIVNLLFDALLHDSVQWHQEYIQQLEKRDLGLLSFRLNQKEKELKSQFETIESNLQPVLTALGDAKNRATSDLEPIEESLEQCNRILASCQPPFSAEKMITSPPSQLENELALVIKKHKLTDVMVKEIREKYPAMYSTLNQIENESEQRNSIEVTFLALNPISYQFGEAEEILRKARDLIQEKAMLRDVGTVRDDGLKDIQKHRSSILNAKTTQSTLEELRTESDGIFSGIEEWYKVLESNLSGSTDEEALLWIGLGEAGGKILRECISYCLSNLSDARCRALLTALGASIQDKKEIFTLMKDIHSGDEDLKQNSEVRLRKIFNDKIHLLAINLGEEIDKLASPEAPGFYYWGEKFNADTTSSTVRTRRNILKLIESGKGAGGATGVGRAYGFRFDTDIKEAMKDVGRKGNRKPVHIVITHSLAGGSGSGMVLPVLEQARRTFGDETVVWVVSVGEGSSEKRHTAKVNTPFILSDVLQAHYDGVHVLYDPVKIEDIRRFKKDVSDSLTKMEESTEKILHLIAKNKVGDNENHFDVLDTILEGGTKSARASKMIRKVESSIDDLRHSLEDWAPKGCGLHGDRFKSVPSFNQKTTMEDLKSKLGSNLLEKGATLLPETSNEAKLFSTWCEDETAGGERPAVQFWSSFRNIFHDPLSMFIRGKDESGKTREDDENSSQTKHYEPDLTGDHLRTLIRRIYSEKSINLNNKKVELTLSKEGLDPLYNHLEDLIKGDEDQELLDEIRLCFFAYASQLDRFNASKTSLDRHILSLSGTGSDQGIKSIIVSNRHLEKGVSQSPKIKVSGEPFTVYNSVIFDLMLNIIGPRLPKEPGVYTDTDAEEFDHADMLGSTKPPLIVGLLNHRDTASLSESHRFGIGEEKPEYPDGFIDMYNTMLNNEWVNPKSSNPLKNMAFVDKTTFGQKYVDLFSSIFGRRFKYLLETNPCSIIEHQDLNFEKIDEFCNSLETIWDNEEEVVYGLEYSNRSSFAKKSGLYGMHIGNLVRWFALIDSKVFAQFISNNKDVDRNFKNINQDDKIWSYIEQREFDIGVLGIDNSLQLYSEHAEMVNSDFLRKIYPKMGLFNAEMLRTVGPAYLNSFLPLAMLQEDISADYYIEKILPPPGSEMFTATSKEDYKEFIQDTWGILGADHSLKLDGKLDSDAEVFIHILKDINHYLSVIDLKLVVKDNSAYLVLHPRLERYFSVIRDIPSSARDHYLPSRSVPASFSRYVHANDSENPLDKQYQAHSQTGIAAPTYALGLDSLNQMRLASLLPDEIRLSVTTLTRILLLTPQSSTEVMNNLETQMRVSGFKSESLNSFFQNILDVHRYGPLDGYAAPSSYCDQTLTLVCRMHALLPLLKHLAQDMPIGWNEDDRRGIMFLKEIIANEDISFSDIESATAILGKNTQSIPQLREWFQDVINQVIMDISADAEVANDDDTSSTVSRENPTITRVKQMFYDLVTLTSEALRQAEYLDDETPVARDVHFEMTGFSDRILGSPSGLLLLVHDRNVNINLAHIKLNARTSLEHFISDFPNSKEFSTASDFGPNSLMTMVLSQAPSGDLADQFQRLMYDKGSGLGGDNPFHPFKESKLHPYMLLYNILWLSVESIGKWNIRSNKYYARRFQIPVKVIQTHYQNPKKLDEDRRTIESNKNDFPGTVKMPERDKGAYSKSVRHRENRHAGSRNMIKYIGIMALRHYNLIDEDRKVKLAANYEAELKSLSENLREQDCTVDLDHLIDPDNNSDGGVKQPGKWSKWSKNTDLDINGSDKDTVESRAEAWLLAYRNWIGYTVDAEPELNNDSTPGQSQIDKFSTSLPSKDSDDEDTLAEGEESNS